MLTKALGLCEAAMRAPDAAGAANALNAQLRRAGACYVQVRLYRRPNSRLTSETHWRAGGILSRSGADGWEGSAAARYIRFEHNPLLQAVRGSVTRYRFSDFAPHGDRRHRTYWEAFSEVGIADGLGANAYARDGRIASVHIGISGLEEAPDDLAAMQLAAGIAAERIVGFEPATPAPERPRLSQRERDVLRYVADGKTDLEIGTILGIAEVTARFHADNARRKLGATNRAHAVARFVATEGW